VEEGEELDRDGWKVSEKDLRDMKAKRWRQKAVDREKWASVFKKANA